MSNFLIKQYPPTHRIDDWEHPWLPLPVRLLNRLPESLIKKITSLEENSLLDSARQSTGLDDFGSDDFLEPFRILLRDLNHYDHFTNLGRITARTILQQQLCARLHLEHKLKQQPQIRALKVDRPLFIAGLPRTGTTHLHNLLSQISALRYMPFWQTLQPATPEAGGTQGRRRAADLAVLSTHYFLPLFPRMHEMQTDDPHEELTLCALCYRSFFFEGTFQAPNYRNWYATHSHEAGYQYLKQVLQILQTEAAPGDKAADARWILKSPQHLDQLQTILQVYPDAHIILTRRDPVHAVLSMITMMLYASRQVYKPQRLREEARAWVDRLEQMLRRSGEQQQQLASARIHPVHFDDFMQDQKQTVLDICDFAQIPVTAADHAALDHYLQGHTRDRYGRIDYVFDDSLFKDIGLNPDQLKERFAFYYA